MSTLYREWIEALKNQNWVNFSGLHLTHGRWNWMVLVKFKNGNPKQALVKVVGLTDFQPGKWSELIQPDLSQAPLTASSNDVFDPFGLAILEKTPAGYVSVLAGNSQYLGILPSNQPFVQTYSWKIFEKRWNLVGSLPLVPPMEVGGICWDGKYLEDYYLSAVRFPDAMEGVLIATLRLGIVVGEFNNLKKNGNNYEQEIEPTKGYKVKISMNQNVNQVDITFSTRPQTVSLRQPSNQATPNPFPNAASDYKLYLFTTP